MNKIRNKNWKFIPNGFEPNNEGIDFVFLYMPSLKCNQNCYYCDILHNNKDILTNEKLKKQYEFIEHIEKITEGRKRNMDLFGGEFLFNINIFDFFDKFYQKWDKFRLFTHLNYYSNEFIRKIAKNYAKLEYVISIHFHQIKDINKFIDKIYILNDYRRKISLRLMFDYKQEKKILKVIDEFYDKYDNIFLEFRPIYGGFKWAEELYQELKPNYPNEDFKIKYNGKIYKVRDWLDLHINTFLMKCEKAGYNELVLYEYGNVYPCESMALKQKGKILNIYKDDFTKFSLKPIKYCSINECRCDWWI